MIECSAFLGGTKWVPRDQLQFRPSVYGLVMHQGRLLLVDLPRTGRRCPPGGGMEAGERMETALKREIREETGIEVSVGPLVGFGESFFYWEDSDQAYHHLAFYYLCTPETMEVCGRGEIDDGEADNPHWAEIESLRAEDFQCHGDLVLDILARLENEIPSLTPGRWDCFGTEVPKQSTEAGMDDLIDCDAFLGGTKWVPRDQLQFRPSVYAVIVHQDRLLVVDVPRTGKWALPGGAIEPGERLESALRREIREEVGIEVTVGVLAGVRDGFFYYEPLDHAFHTIVCYYRGTPATFKLPEERQIQDTETRRPHWVEIPGLRAEDFQFHGDLILELLAHLGSESPSPVVLGRPETLEEI